MEDWSVCSICNYSHESMMEMPCCSAVYCSGCLASRAACYNCRKVFDIKKCTSVFPLNSLTRNVIIECRHPGCDYKSTEFLIQKHETACTHNPVYKSEIVTLLEPSQTPQAKAHLRRMNIFGNFLMYSNVRHVVDCLDKGLSLDNTPLSIPNNGDGFYTHIILEGDTLSGLSIKYKVSSSKIKEVNRLFSDRIHERTALKIPIAHTPTFSERETSGLENMLRARLVSRFRRKTGITSTQEALYYLEQCEMDMKAAYLLWAEDYSWEKTALPFKSCMPLEEIEIFKPQHKRGCCSLVF